MPFKFTIVFEDEGLALIDKPAGLLVHPVAPDSIALTQYLPLGWHPCHRLDRDTSGCLLIAKNPKAARAIGLALMRGQVQKRYVAMVCPAPAESHGEITLPLFKINARMRPDARGQSAHTSWRVLRRLGEQALLVLTPHTGRTHQLRAHLSAMGWPIRGDCFYGGAPAPRLMLHAYSLKLPNRPWLRAAIPRGLCAS